ncbi:MAG: hypothetical protein JST39_15945, partial [Bacteroidetes bacterium]|nr:hypothetical protein [Bacteroidota bacterium]
MAKYQDEQDDMFSVQEALQKELGLLSPAMAFAEWRGQLVNEISRLIQYDFNRL